VVVVRVGGTCGGASDVSESFGVESGACGGEDFVQFVEGVGVGSEPQSVVDLRPEGSAVGVVVEWGVVRAIVCVVGVVGIVSVFRVWGGCGSGGGHDSGSGILELFRR